MTSSESRVGEMKEEKASLRLLDIILSTLVSLLTLIASWALFEIVGLKQDMAVVKETRFTTKEAELLKDELAKEINTAPRWLNEKLSSLDESDRLMKQSLQIISEKMDLLRDDVRDIKRP